MGAITPELFEDLANATGDHPIFPMKVPNSATFNDPDADKLIRQCANGILRAILLNAAIKSKRDPKFLKTKADKRTTKVTLTLEFKNTFVHPNTGAVNLFNELDSQIKNIQNVQELNSKKKSKELNEILVDIPGIKLDGFPADTVSKDAKVVELEKELLRTLMAFSCGLYRLSCN